MKEGSAGRWEASHRPPGRSPLGARERSVTLSGRRRRPGEAAQPCGRAAVRARGGLAALDAIDGLDAFHLWYASRATVPQRLARLDEAAEAIAVLACGN